MDIHNIKVKEEVPDVDLEFPYQIYDDVIVKEEHIIQDVIQPVRRKTAVEDESVYFEITENIPNLDENEKKHICTKCGKAVKKACDLKRHMISHSNERNYQCPECPRTFKHQRSQMLHSRSHSENVSTISCHICNSKLKSTTYLKQHIRLQHDTIKTKYECIHCGNMFATKYSLNKHTRRFHDEDRMEKEEKPLICPECGKSYSVRNQNHYERHVESHKSLKCKICFRKYANKTSLKTHMGSHSSERPFGCDICDKTFRLLDYLTNHRKTHFTPSEPPTKCIYCSKSFIRKSSLKSHMKKIHRGLPKVEGAVPACTLCKKICKDLEELKKHVKRHNVDNKFECAICGMRTRYKYLMGHHIRKDHLKMQDFRHDNGAENHTLNTNI